MRLTIATMKHLRDNVSVDIQNCPKDLTSLCDARSYSRLTYLIHRLNRRLYDQVSAIKEEKFSRLTTTQPARYTRNTQTMNTVLQDNNQSTDRLVVGTPEDLALDEDERSPLAKGINFIPTTPTTDELTSKEDTEKFFRRVRLKAHFTEDSSRVTTGSDAPSEVTNDNLSYRCDGVSSGPNGDSINETNQPSRPYDHIF